MAGRDGVGEAKKLKSGAKRDRGSKKNEERGEAGSGGESFRRDGAGSEKSTPFRPLKWINIEQSQAKVSIAFLVNMMSLAYDKQILLKNSTYGRKTFLHFLFDINS